MDITYAEVGTEVILGRYNHQRWVWTMEPYVGKQTRITKISITDPSWCRVEADGGMWCWPILGMILATEKALVREGDPRFTRR
jgi:hypothetical protein